MLTVLDLRIVGGHVVTPGGTEAIDLGVAHGRIAMLTDRGAMPAANKTIDAANMIVMPGAVDPHVHVNSRQGHGGDRSSEGCLSRADITKAALYGGTTTVIDFSWHTVGRIAETLQRDIDAWAGTSFADYAFHVVLSGTLSKDLLEEVPTITASGFPSFKIFMTDISPHDSVAVSCRVPLGSISDLLEATSACGGVVTIHAEDNEMVMNEYRKHREDERVDLRFMHEVHSRRSEDLSFRQVLQLASHIPNAAVYFHHVTSDCGVAAIGEYRSLGLAAYGEAIPVLAVNTSTRYREDGGARYHIYPSLKSPEDVRSIWEGVRAGLIHTFGTDGACPLWRTKNRSRDIAEAFGGVNGLEPKLAVLYTEMIEKRGMTLTRLAEVTSGNAARIFGLFPKKGAIAVGSDADLVVMDPRDRRTLCAGNMHEGDWTPWEGYHVSAWPAHTILRGQSVVSHDRLLVPKAGGELQRRSSRGGSVERLLDSGADPR